LGKREAPGLRGLAYWLVPPRRAACEPECPVEAIYPEYSLPEKWQPFVKIRYAYGDTDTINRLVDEYATEHNGQNPPLETPQL